MSLTEILLLFVFYGLGIAVAAMPSFITIRRARLRTITKSGKWFIGLIVALFIVSICKDFFSARKSADDEAKIRRFMRMSDSLQLATSARHTDSLNSLANSLVRSDTLHSQQMIGFMGKLDDWGLEIRDSNIVRKQPGSPLVVVNDVRLDSLRDGGTVVRIYVCNNGTSEAFDVRVYYFAAIPENNNIYSQQLSYNIQDISGGDCLLRSFPFPKGVDTRSYYYLIMGDYLDVKKVRRTFNYSYCFDRILNEWGFKSPPIEINETIPLK